MSKHKARTHLLAALTDSLIEICGKDSPLTEVVVKPVSKFLLLVVLTVAQLALGLQAQDNQGQATSEQELRKVEREWDAAIVSRDVAALDRILSEDFRYIDSAGDVHSKNDIVQGVKSSEAVIEPFETEDVQVRIYGDTAVLTGRFMQKASYQGKTYSGQFRYTDIYVRQGGLWRAVSAHASRIPDAKK
jgi:ketosteroid isomerase-like protein